MKIDSLKDLKQVLKACRENGVTAIEVDGIKLNILPISEKKSTFDVANDFPEARLQVPAFNGPVTSEVIGSPRPSGAIVNMPTQMAADKIATDELTEEQLMFYSARPEPDFNPAEQ